MHIKCRRIEALVMVSSAAILSRRASGMQVQRLELEAETARIRSAEGHSAGRPRIVWAKGTEILSSIQMITARKGDILKYPTMPGIRRK